MGISDVIKFTGQLPTVSLKVYQIRPCQNNSGAEILCIRVGTLKLSPLSPFFWVYFYF